MKKITKALRKAVQKEFDGPLSDKDIVEIITKGLIKKSNDGYTKAEIIASYHETGEHPAFWKGYNDILCQEYIRDIEPANNLVH